MNWSDFQRAVDGPDTSPSGSYRCVLSPLPPRTPRFRPAAWGHREDKGQERGHPGSWVHRTRETAFPSAQGAGAYARGLRVVALAVVLKGPAPALLYARTAAWCARLLLRPPSVADVSLAATVTVLADSSSPLLQ